MASFKLWLTTILVRIIEKQINLKYLQGLTLFERSHTYSLKLFYTLKIEENLCINSLIFSYNGVRNFYIFPSLF